MSHAGLGLREEPLYEGTLGASDLGSSCNHLSSFILFTFNTRSLSITLAGIKTRLSHKSLAIDVARDESTDLAIATAIGQREVIVRGLSVTCCKYHLEKRGL